MKRARFKDTLVQVVATLRKVALWLIGVSAVLSVAGGAAFGAYYLLQRWVGLAPGQAASIAVPLGPSMVVAIFTVALWRATERQAEATRLMRELQVQLSRPELEVFLYFSFVVAIWNDPPEQPSLQIRIARVGNLGKYGILVRKIEFFLRAGEKYVLIARWEGAPFVVKGEELTDLKSIRSDGFDLPVFEPRETAWALWLNMRFGEENIGKLRVSLEYGGTPGSHRVVELELLALNAEEFFAQKELPRSRFVYIVTKP